ncbi:MAG: hypothetical protein ABIP46_11540 [Polaromonas sp.]
MDILILAALVAILLVTLKSRDQRGRIALLAHHLGQYQIEKLMETLTQGYLRALGESDLERRTQIWALLATTESQLASQFTRFATGFALVEEANARVSTLPVGLPYAVKLLPAASFDVRQAFVIHAQGISEAAANALQRSPRDKAFTLSAELFLMQHTCHWFCRSKTVASARLLMQHQTAYEQVLASVGERTRLAYGNLVGQRAN